MPLASWALVAVLAALAAAGAWATPTLVLVAALGPVLGWSGIVLLMARRERPPWDVVAAAILSGAVLAASLAAFVNELALGWEPLAGRGRVVPILVGPLVEEVAKGLVLVLIVALRRDALTGPRAGVVWGALTGLGFTLHENLHYVALAALQSGWPGLVQSVVVRGVVGGPIHAVFAAATGAGVGWALAGGTRWRVWPMALGLGVACAQHVLWNALGAVLIMEALCGPAFAVSGCALPPEPVPPVAVVLVTLLFLAPGAALVLLVGRAASAGRRSAQA